MIPTNRLAAINATISVLTPERRATCLAILAATDKTGDDVTASVRAASVKVRGDVDEDALVSILAAMCGLVGGLHVLCELTPSKQRVALRQTHMVFRRWC